MRIIYPSVARNAYYDRTPTFLTKRYEATLIAPHVQAVRWTYTVPANKRAVLQEAHIFIVRSGVAIGADYAEAQLSIQSGGIFSRFIHVAFIDNTGGKAFYTDTQTTIYLDTGQIMQAITADASNGGTLDYYVNAFIMEYDR